MKMTVVVPVFGYLYDSKPYWSTLIGNTNLSGPDQTDLLIIDNGPNCGDNQKEFFERFVFSRWQHGNVTYSPQVDNLGLVVSMQYAYENTDSEILAFIHNDLYICEHDWNQKVMDWFKEYPNTGLLGFFGAEGIHPSSGRFNVWNNMLEAELHGMRFAEGYRQVAVLDGLCMIASRKMLDAKGGVDTSFRIHHFYDLDLSLESISRGFENYVLPIYCHHQSGVTACRPLFQEWANRYVGVAEKGENILYNENLQRFKDKWADKLPYSVMHGWRRGVR